MAVCLSDANCTHCTILSKRGGKKFWKVEFDELIFSGMYPDGDKMHFDDNEWGNHEVLAISMHFLLVIKKRLSMPRKVGVHVHYAGSVWYFRKKKDIVMNLVYRTSTRLFV